jgi:hypothetical protein
MCWGDTEMKMKSVFLIIVMAAGILACEKAEYELKGFAFYEKVETPYLFKAITPEGVVLQGRKEWNDPENTKADFWAEAVENYVPKRGYQLVKKGSLDKGRYFIFLVPGAKYDYFYLVHFITGKDEIRLLEAGGRYAYLKDYQQRILDFSRKVWEKD